MFDTLVSNNNVRVDAPLALLIEPMQSQEQKTNILFVMSMGRGLNLGPASCKARTLLQYCATQVARHLSYVESILYLEALLADVVRLHEHAHELLQGSHFSDGGPAHQRNEVAGNAGGLGGGSAV